MASSWDQSWSPSWSNTWGTLSPPAPRTPSWLLTWGASWADSWGVVDFEPTPAPLPPALVGRPNLISPADRIEEPTLVTRLHQMLEMLLDGRSRNIIEVTLTENATTTTVIAPMFESHQVPVLVPLSAAAADEIANGTVYVSAREKGQFTITHANDPSTSRDFGFIFVG